MRGHVNFSNKKLDTIVQSTLRISRRALVSQKETFVLLITILYDLCSDFAENNVRTKKIWQMQFGNVIDLYVDKGDRRNFFTAKSEETVSRDKSS